MNALIPNVTAFEREAPDSQLELDPLLGGQAIDVTIRTIADSAVTDR